MCCCSAIIQCSSVTAMVPLVFALLVLLCATHTIGHVCAMFVWVVCVYMSLIEVSVRLNDKTNEIFNFMVLYSSCIYASRFTVTEFVCVLGSLSLSMLGFSVSPLHFDRKEDNKKSFIFSSLFFTVGKCVFWFSDRTTVALYCVHIWYRTDLFCVFVVRCVRIFSTLFAMWLRFRALEKQQSIISQ